MTEKRIQFVINNVHISMMVGLLTVFGAFYAAVNWIAAKNFTEDSLKADILELKAATREMRIELNTVSRQLAQISNKLQPSDQFGGR